MKTRLTITTIIVIATFITSCQQKNKVNNVLPNQKEARVLATEFVQRIDELGYFKYAEKEYIDSLKQEHLKSFNQEGSWGAIWDWETFTPLDYRYYLCDGESVYEFEGFTDMLKELQPTFNKIGFQHSIDNHIEELDKDGFLNHSITINGTNYTIFKKFEGYGWGEAVQRFVEIINTELEKQQISERIYPVSAGNEGMIIFLDQPLYEYFYQVFENPQAKPLEVKEWANVMKVPPMQLD